MMKNKAKACIRAEFSGPVKPCAKAEVELRAIWWKPEKRPLKGTVIYLHSGDFRRGTPEEVDAFAPQICARDLAVLSVSYRLGGLAADLSPEMAELHEALNREAGPAPQGLAPHLHGPAAFCAIEDVRDMINLAASNEAIGGLGRVALLGQGGGAIVALALASIPALTAALAPPLAGVLSLSGAMPFLDQVDPRQGPPVLWLHGAADDEIAAHSARRFAEVAADRPQPSAVYLSEGAAQGMDLLAQDGGAALLWDFAEAVISGG